MVREIDILRQVQNQRSGDMRDPTRPVASVGIPWKAQEAIRDPALGQVRRTARRHVQQVPRASARYDREAPTARTVQESATALERAAGSPVRKVQAGTRRVGVAKALSGEEGSHDEETIRANVPAEDFLQRAHGAQDTKAARRGAIAIPDQIAPDGNARRATPTATPSVPKRAKRHCQAQGIGTQAQEAIVIESQYLVCRCVEVPDGGVRGVGDIADRAGADAVGGDEEDGAGRVVVADVECVVVVVGSLRRGQG